jgi:hypothetical protein
MTRQLGEDESEKTVALDCRKEHEEETNGCERAAGQVNFYWT